MVDSCHLKSALVYTFFFNILFSLFNVLKILSHRDKYKKSSSFSLTIVLLITRASKK